MKRFLEDVRIFCSRRPCVPALCAVLAGSWVFLLNENAAFSTCVFASIPFLLFSWSVLGSRNALFRCVPWLCLVLISVFFRTRPGPETALPEGPFGCEAEIRLSDPTLTGGLPGKIPASPHSVRGRVLRWRYSFSDAWKIPEKELLFFVTFPTEMNFSPGYGDVVCMKGRVDPVENIGIPGAFDYRNYARVRGVSKIFKGYECRKLLSGKSFLRSLCDARGYFLERIGYSMTPEELGVASALLFGLRQGIPGGLQRAYLHSGTIHVLSVSGLHIGLFAGVLLALLAFLPYRMRFLLLLPGVFLYVLSTGMLLPAFRAFCMLCVWCVLRTFLRRTDPLNGLGAAALFLLVWNPLYLLDAGFEFSFLCVFFLLYSADFLREVRMGIYASEKFKLDSSGRKKRRFFRTSPLLIGATGFVAYFASVSVSLYHQGLFSPAAVPAFLLLSPLAWFAFALFAAALICLPIPGAAELFGKILEWTVSCMNVIVRTMGDGTAFYTMPVPWSWTALFLLIFLILLLVRKRAATLICSAGMVLLVVFAMVRPLLLRDEAVVFSSGEGRPMILILSPRSGMCVALNAPGYRTCRAAVSYLRSRGISEIQELFLESPRKECSAGCAFLLRMIPVRTLRYEGKLRKNTARANEAFRIGRALGRTELAPLRGIVSITKNENVSVFRAYRSTVLLRTVPERGVLVKIQTERGKEKEIFFPLSPDFRFSVTLL